MTEGGAARRYLRRHRHGVLSTLSKKFDGYPFGSVVPYAADHAGRPLLLISRLAEHTKNITADPRASLIVHTPDVDPQAAARVTLIGNAVPVDDDLAAVKARYLGYFPDAQRLVALGDFAFHRIDPLAVRFIGGFGAIHWIAAANYAPPNHALAACEADIIAHMNTDHADTLRNCCRHFKQHDAATVAMVGVDCDGFDVRADGTLLRFDFEEPVTDAHGVRRALVALARETRG